MPTNEPRPIGEEEEADSTKAKAVSASAQAPGVAGVSKETRHKRQIKNSKVDDKQNKNVSEADEAYSSKDTSVSASTQDPCVGDESQQTKEAERESKEDGDVADCNTVKSLFASTQATQVPA
jgi:hypothetical protein